MNAATNIIFKAKIDQTNEWVTGHYYPVGRGIHIIRDFKTATHEINPATLCIGCVIGDREYFAGDKFVWPEYGTTGFITFNEYGFRLRYSENNAYQMLSEYHEHISITGNIHD